MTHQEFQNLKVGDRLEFRGVQVYVTSLETEYDFTSRPPKENVWQAQVSNGCSIRFGDPHFEDILILSQVQS